MKLPANLESIINHLKRLPGIGEKSATRMALNICNWSQETLDNLSENLKSLPSLGRCQECGFFADEDLCSVCKSEHRQNSRVICVVENITDYMAIENSGEYHGIFHTLGGVLNPLMGVGPEELAIDKLIEKIQNKNIEEVILAINPSVEGDATCAYIKKQMNPNVRVQRIGFGIPMGGSLEYLDALTIGKALENRKAL